MWKILFIIIIIKNGNGNVDAQVFGDNWKRAMETSDDSDFIRSNETELDGIPKFLKKPEKVYHVYENKPATITCIAEPVSHVNIICNKIIYSYMDKEVSESNLRVQKMNKENQLDPHGERWMFSLDVTYNQVTEWFNTYSCVCEAWNQVPVLRQAKKIHSNYGIIKEAYFKTKFRKVPQSTNLQKGQRLILSCVPPESKRKPLILWLKDGERIYDNDRIKIVEEYQLSINDVVISDTGNYSCIATSLNERRYSPIAAVKIYENIMTEWSPWSKCDSHCKKIRKRECYHSSDCKDLLKQVEKCSGDCQYYQVVTPSVKIHSKNGISSNNVQSTRDIAMYIGLFVAVSVLVMVMTIMFCLIRRKALMPLRSSMRYPLDINGNGIGFDAKSNIIKNSNIINMKNHNDSTIQQKSYFSQSPPNLPPPTCFSDISSNNAYSTGIDISYNSTGSGAFSQPLISNSSSMSTTHKSKATNSSNTDGKVEPITRSHTPMNSRPSSALYHELSLDRESITNNPPFVPENIDLSTLSWATITSAGGRLCLPQSGISLTIVNGSFINSSSNEMFMAVFRNDPNPPILSESETLLTPIVLFGPSDVQILKPCVLSIPHSADLKQGNWVIRLMACSTPSQLEEDVGEVKPSVWKNISTIGCETDSTPIYTHLDPYCAHILMDKCQKICLVGQSYPGGKATKRLRLAAFGRPLSLNPYLSNYNIRAYIFSDTKEAFESVSTIEMKMGSTLLDNTHQIIFSDGLGNLFFCIEELSSGWKNQLTTKYQEIPFTNIWNGNQSESLHCSFTFDSFDQSQQSFMCRIVAYQSGFYNYKQTITIKQDKIERNGTKRDLIKHEKVLLHSETNNTYLDPLTTVFRISIPTKKRLCMLLDNFTSRGNDWRQLARQLNLNGYINYFLTKVSPTETILSLWEAKNRSENAVNDLIHCFKAIGRIDCASLLEGDLSSS